MNENMEQNEKNQGDYCDDLHAWVDTISSSKHKKNFTRDFSDAVLMAEILKVYYPRYVDLHNYIPASSIQMKRDNWNTLNRKVLTKIDMKLNKEMINQLANAHQGVIEKVLSDLRAKLSKDGQCFRHVCNDNKDFMLDSAGMREESNVEDMKVGLAVSENSIDQGGQKISPYHLILTSWTNSLLFALKWITSWIFIWNFFSRRCTRNAGKCTINISPRQMTSTEQDTNVMVPGLLGSQLGQELREKIAVITVLGEKVASLEREVKLLEKHISEMLTYFVENSGDSDQCPKQQNVMSYSKLRARPHNISENKTN